MNRSERAMQVWQVLICAAANRKILTYTIVSSEIGLGGPNLLSQTLKMVEKLCILRDYPNLACLVVSQETGEPGSGISEMGNISLMREKVFSHKWFSMRPIQIDDFNNLAID